MKHQNAIKSKVVTSSSIASLVPSSYGVGPLKKQSSQSGKTKLPAGVFHITVLCIWKISQKSRKHFEFPHKSETHGTNKTAIFFAACTLVELW